MSIFNENSPILRFLTRAYQLALLNILTLLCSLPIVTGGAALTAMHYVLFHMVRGEDSHIVRAFFRSFRQNFRQATVLWLIELAVVWMTVTEVRLLGLFSPGGPAHPAQWLILLPALFFAFVFLYLFPYLSRFDNRVREVIVNSVYLAVRHVPKTLAQMLILAAYAALVWFVLPMPFWPVLAFVGLTLPAWLRARIYTPLLLSLETEED